MVKYKYMHGIILVLSTYSCTISCMTKQAKLQLLDDAIRTNNEQKYYSVLDTSCITLPINQEQGNTLLHSAAECDTLWAIPALLHHGADINAQDKNLDTPLHIACKKSKTNALHRTFAKQLKI